MSAGCPPERQETGIHAKPSPPDAPAWCRALGDAQGPIYVAIADALERGVADGLLSEGERMPTHRHLASLLGIDLTTVTRAYTVATRRGLLVAHVGRGTFVRAGAGRGERAVVDLTMNLPPSPDDPALADTLRVALARLSARADLPALMFYRLGAGTDADREAGARWLAPCIGRVDPARVLVCPGTQSAMLALATTLTRPGDTIAAEDVTYPGIRAMAAQLGLRVAGVATDQEGLLPDALDRVCATEQPRLVYCNPTIQNPTTATMGETRRRQVASVLSRHGTVLLEDDAYGLFPGNPMPSLSSLLPTRAFYVATTAKSLSPGLRVSFMIAPDTIEAVRLAAALRATVLMQSGLLTSLVTGWIRNGEAHAMLAAIRREAASRQRLARQVLGSAGTAHPDGLHVWLQLPSRWQSGAFISHVRDEGLALVGSEAFVVDGPPPRAVRIALGAAASRDALAQALGRVAAAIRRDPPANYAAVI